MSLFVRDVESRQPEFQMFVLDEMADALSSRGRDIIKLTIGITELPIPEPVLDVLSDALRDPGRTRMVHPEGLPALREAIAEYYVSRFGAPVDARQVIVNVGTSAIFRNLLWLLCRPGSEVLLPRPYYCLYLCCALLADVEPRFYDLDLTTGRVDLESFERAYDPARTSLVILNSPGNPLGNVLSAHEIGAIYEIVAGRSYVVSDEIYANMRFEGEPSTPLVSVPSHRETTIVANGFSKGFRMYTKRVGYAILPEALRMPMRILQQHTLLTADPVAQSGMVEALRDDESPRAVCALYRERAERTVERLSGTHCRPLRPRGGFYITLDCARWIEQRKLGTSRALAEEILQRVGVATVPGSDFGAPTTLRLAFCNARYDEAVDRLRGYFTSASCVSPVGTDRQVGEPAQPESGRPAGRSGELEVLARSE